MNFCVDASFGTWKLHLHLFYRLCCAFSASCANYWNVEVPPLSAHLTLPSCCAIKVEVISIEASFNSDEMSCVSCNSTWSHSPLCRVRCVLNCNIGKWRWGEKIRSACSLGFDWNAEMHNVAELSHSSSFLLCHAPLFLCMLSWCFPRIFSINKTKPPY